MRCKVGLRNALAQLPITACKVKKFNCPVASGCWNTSPYEFLSRLANRMHYVVFCNKFNATSKKMTSKSLLAKPFVKV